MTPHRSLADFYIAADQARLHYWRANYQADPEMRWQVWFFGEGPHMSYLNFFAWKTRKKLGRA